MDDSYRRCQTVYNRFWFWLCVFKLFSLQSWSTLLLWFLIPCIIVFVLRGLQGDTGNRGPSAKCNCSQVQRPEQPSVGIQTVSVDRCQSLSPANRECQSESVSCLDGVKQARMCFSSDLCCSRRETDEETARGERDGAADRQKSSIHLH